MNAGIVTIGSSLGVLNIYLLQNSTELKAIKNVPEIKEPHL